MIFDIKLNARKEGYDLTFILKIQYGRRPPSWRWLQNQKLTPDLKSAVSKYPENIFYISLYYQNYLISIFLYFSKWRLAAILNFSKTWLLVWISFLKPLAYVLSQKKWFLTLNLMPGKRVTFLPLFWKSNMAAGRHLEYLAYAGVKKKNTCEAM